MKKRKQPDGCRKLKTVARGLLSPFYSTRVNRKGNCPQETALPIRSQRAIGGRAADKSRDRAPIHAKIRIAAEVSDGSECGRVVLAANRGVIPGKHGIPGTSPVSGDVKLV